MSSLDRAVASMVGVPFNGLYVLTADWVAMPPLPVVMVTLPTTLLRHRRDDGSRRRIGRRAAPLVAFVLLAFGMRSLKRVEVTGYSMSPALLPGDKLLVVTRPWGRSGLPNPGEVVAVRDPRPPDRILIKRVEAVHVDRGVDGGTVTVVGDNRTASTDSRTFGEVPRGSILGRVVYRYAPSSRKGPIVTRA